MSEQKSNFQRNEISKTMKQQGITELSIAIAGLTILLILKNEWSYIPLILYGVLSVATIRRNNTVLTDKESKCMKKRNRLSIILLPLFAGLCYFSANEIIRSHFLWILLSMYLFLAAHGLMFMAPLRAFGNERK